MKKAYIFILVCQLLNSFASVNHYNTLGVSSQASPRTIHEAYLSLIKKHHPDLKTGNKEITSKLNEAYEVLKDPNRRLKYDITCRFDKFRDVSKVYIADGLINSKKTAISVREWLNESVILSEQSTNTTTMQENVLSSKQIQNISSITRKSPRWAVLSALLIGGLTIKYALDTARICAVERSKARESLETRPS